MKPFIRQYIFAFIGFLGFLLIVARYKPSSFLLACVLATIAFFVWLVLVTLAHTQEREE